MEHDRDHTVTSITVLCDEQPERLEEQQHRFLVYFHCYCSCFHVVSTMKIAIRK